MPRVSEDPYPPFGLRWRLFDFDHVEAEIKSARGRNAKAPAAYRLSVLRDSEDVENAFSSLVNRERQQRTLANGERSLARAQARTQSARAAVASFRSLGDGWGAQPLDKLTGR